MENKKIRENNKIRKKQKIRKIFQNQKKKKLINILLN